MNSRILASTIEFDSEQATFTMDTDSVLATIGRGHISGYGSSNENGASYAGQGGTQHANPIQKTYGSFSQQPDNKDYHSSQMGSGNTLSSGEHSHRGGGVIVIKVKTGTISGKLNSDGSPEVQMESEFPYNAGSGGYIYISCSTSCQANNEITAVGGYGSESSDSNSGSGGRIVLNKVTVTDNSQLKANGGCTNSATSTSFNGAAGTIYLVDTNILYVKNTLKCVASLRTILDPHEIEELDVKAIYVSDQATVAFSNDRVSRDFRLDATINNLFLTNSSLTNPIAELNPDLKIFELRVSDTLHMVKSKFLRVANDFIVTTKNFVMDLDSEIKYHNDLWINIDSAMSISGLIQPSEKDFVKSDSSPKVHIQAGVGVPAPQSPYGYDAMNYALWNTSRIIGRSIQIFSDHNLTISGNLENTIETSNGPEIVGSCLLQDQVKEDVFRCVYQGFSAAALTHDTLVNRFNSQYPSRENVKDITGMFGVLSEQYSVYIQTLKHLALNGTIVGSRVGLCSTDITMHGVINATEGG